MQPSLAASPSSPEFATARDELLLRLVALNAQRAAEEAHGQVRWLRPTFQNSLLKKELLAHSQQGIEVNLAYKWPVPVDALPNATHLAANGAIGAAPGSATGAAPTQPWPATLPEQVKAVAQVLVSSAAAQTLAQIEARFTGRGAWKKSLPTLLQTLQALGRAQQTEAAGVAYWRA